MKHKFTLERLSDMFGAHYRNINSTLAVLRVMLIIPLIIICYAYSDFIQFDKADLNAWLFGYKLHPWTFVLFGGTLVYCLSIMMDITVALCKKNPLKYYLGTVARYVRILTYFFVAVTLANFTYKSYVVNGLTPPLHLLLFSAMGLLIILIFFHAYQCREGLVHGGIHSEKHS